MSTWTTSKAVQDFVRTPHLLEPGDMLCLNNHHNLDARSTFSDVEYPDEKRHLRRLWLESLEWGGKRPQSMENLLRVSSTWKSPDSNVQMWDHM